MSAKERGRASATDDGEAHSSRTPQRSSSWPVRCGTCRSEAIWDGGIACPQCGSPWPRRRVSKRLRLQIADRDGWICHRCRNPIDPALSEPPWVPRSRSGIGRHALCLVADHYPVSLSEGGPTIPANLRAAHSLCNGSGGSFGALTRSDVAAQQEILGMIAQLPFDRYGAILPADLYCTVDRTDVPFVWPTPFRLPFELLAYYWFFRPGLLDPHSPPCPACLGTGGGGQFGGCPTCRGQGRPAACANGPVGDSVRAYGAVRRSCPLGSGIARPRLQG